jgi:serine/threonine protein kinase
MSRNGTDPASDEAAVPLEGDGHEMLGRVIAGKFRLESTLGRGGMGLVFRATQLTLRRQAAVKLLHPSLAVSVDVRNRFEREVYASGKINHPNCVAIYDSGHLADGSLYLAMELLEGRALSEVLEEEGQIAPGRALHILAHVLRGLGHIHNAGLIHRDIKPENIFLIRQGDDLDFAKILDFGIAKGIGRGDLDDGVKLTQAGMAFGTPIYMAPEQALGNPMDGRADLYAAAVVAYEMLCGQPPFYSDDKLEVMSMHTAKPVPPMRARLIKGGRPVPSSIERLIVKGLTKKPLDRYTTAEQFEAAVEHALETPDGGVTDVSFERVHVPRERNTTGSQPLVSDDGRVEIEDAIDEALNAPSIEPEVTLPDAPRLPTSTTPDAPTFGMRKSAPAMGGVGIGLPYTGPLGEPIFGLTPEQRLAQVNPAHSIAGALEPELVTRPHVKGARGRPRWVIYAAIGAAAVVGGIIIALLTVPGDGGEEDKPERPKTPLVTEADGELGRGRIDHAIQLLEEHKDAIARDAEAQLVLGHAYSAKSDNAHALAAYTQALQVDQKVGIDERLRTSLRTMAALADPSTVMRAFDLWMYSGDPEAPKALLNAAVAESLARRHAAIPVVEHHHLEKQVEWWIAYGWDLVQEPDCADRKLAVARLRALGDRRGIPALERVISKYDKKRHRENACLINEAKAALGYLQGLPQK